MNVFDLAAKITLDDSQYTGALNKLHSGIATIGKVAFGAVTAATGAVTAFGVSSVKTGETFDKSMSQVAATMGKTMADMENEVGSVDLAWGTFSGNLRDYALEMGRNTAFSATEAADALNYMALAGYDTQTSMEMLPNVLNLAAAGDMELARASDMVTDTQTAFGISLERTSQMVDEMAKAASTGNTNVEQLGDAFLVVGGLAQELNGGMVTLADGTTAETDGIQELEIALTAMANAGIKGSEAGTHMRNMLLKLSSPTDDGVERLQQLGVSVFDTEGNMRSLKDVMGDLSGALGNLTQEQKIQAISDLFNTRDLASAEALLNAVGQDWDKIGASILDAEGAAQKMADTQLDNLAGDVTLFKSALEGAKIAISDELSPTLRQFTQFGTDALSTLTAAFKEGGLTGAMDALGTILSDGLSMVIEMLPQMIEAGMQLLGALGQGLLDNLPVIIDAAVQIITMLMLGIVEALPQVVEGAFQIILGLAQGIVEALPELIPAITSTIQRIIELITENLPLILDAGIQILFAIVDGIAQSLPELIPAIVDAVFTIIDTLIQHLPEIIQAGIEILFALIEGIINAIPVLIERLPEIIDTIVTVIIQNLPLIIEAGVQLILALIVGLIQAIPDIIAALPEIIDSIIDAFASVDWLDVGYNLIMGIVDGIVSAASALWDAVVGVVSDAWNGLLDWLGIASPSRKARDQIGKQWSKGIGVGFVEGMPTDDMVESVADAFDEVQDVQPPIFEPMLADDDFAVDTIEVGGVGGKIKSSSEEPAPIQINVYASADQDEKQIAYEVQKVLAQWQRQKDLVFA